MNYEETTRTIIRYQSDDTSHEQGSCMTSSFNRWMDFIPIRQALTITSGRPTEFRVHTVPRKAGNTCQRRRFCGKLNTPTACLHFLITCLLNEWRSHFQGDQRCGPSQEGPDEFMPEFTGLSHSPYLAPNSSRTHCERHLNWTECGCVALLFAVSLLRHFVRPRLLNLVVCQHVIQH